jgi:hypothetical protein
MGGADYETLYCRVGKNFMKCLFFFTFVSEYKSY